MTAALTREQLAQLIEHATEVAQTLGTPVFPVRVEPDPTDPHKSTKRPLIKGWANGAAVSDPKAIAELFKQHASAVTHCGLQTGRIVVIDLDGEAAQAWWCEHRNMLPETRTVDTRRPGGKHLFYRVPAGVVLRNSASRIAPGVDFRGVGGFVVDWSAEHPPAVEEVADAPDALIEFLQRASSRSEKTNGADGATAEDAFIHAGGRNAFLSKEAYRLRKLGFSVEQIYPVLWAMNLARCRPPLPEDEVHTIAEGKSHIAPDEPTGGDAERRLDALAALDRIEYEQRRKDAAKELGIRTTALDAEVAKRRPAHAAGTAEDTLGIPTIEPAAEPVVGAAVLDAVAALIREHVICDAHAAAAAALWSAMTYLAADVDCIQTLPLVVITAPDRQCGKTTLLGALSRLVQRPLPAANVSAAAMYRVIEKVQPTLLVDEADTFLRFNDELRGVINSGHTRDSAFVLRCVGDDHEPRQFSTWCPKVLSGIGDMPATIMDRAIQLPLRRKLAGESIARFRDNKERFGDCARRLARFAADVAGAVRLARPELPDLGSARAQDNWEPLIALADAAGGDWPERARAAAIALAPTGERSTESRRVMLLADIREYFTSDPFGMRQEAVPTKVLLGHLHTLSERPWPTAHRKREPLTDRQLADLLRPYGIASKTLRFGADPRAKGYERKQFEDAWQRYLPARAGEEQRK